MAAVEQEAKETARGARHQLRILVWTDHWAGPRFLAHRDAGIGFLVETDEQLHWYVFRARTPVPAEMAADVSKQGNTLLRFLLQNKQRNS